MTVAAPTPSIETGSQTLEDLKLSAITPAPDNPRTAIGDVDELAASMGELGMLQPLVVTPRKGKFMVVCGHRRFAAAKKAKLATVPAIVRSLDEPQRIKAMLVENCQRTDLTAIEEARAYQRLVDLGITQHQIAADVGKAQSHISKRLALLELTPAAQAELDSGGITLDDARVLLTLKDMPKRLDSALKDGKRGRNMDFTVRQEVHAHELAEKNAAAIAKLKKAGIRIVDYVKNDYDYYAHRLPKGMAKLVGRNGYAYNGEIQLDPKTHATEPCHAAAVDSRGEIVYLCTTPANHKAANASPDEKADRAKGRDRERAGAIKARDNNLELGRALEKKFATAKLDMRTVRLLVDLLLEARGEFGTQLALRSFRYTDEASQEVVTRKDGSVSRIRHVSDVEAARKLLDDRINAAKTPEELAGVLLQALISARYVDRDAVPSSQRSGYLAFIDSSYYEEQKKLKQTLEAIAKPVLGKSA